MHIHIHIQVAFSFVQSVGGFLFILETWLRTPLLSRIAVLFREYSVSPMLDGLAPEKAINTSCPQTLEAYVVYVVAKTESKKQSVLGKQPQIRLFLL